jgi:hypothetical protein
MIEVVANYLFWITVVIFVAWVLWSFIKKHQDVQGGIGHVDTR